MLATRIIGWISFFFIVGFLIYGFRQGFRAKAEAKKNLAPSGRPSRRRFQRRQRPFALNLAPRPPPAAAAGACQ